MNSMEYKHPYAKGFLEADAQWRERVKPLVEALAAAWQIEDCFQVPLSLGVNGCAVIRKALERFRELTPKALSDFKREVEE